MESQMNLVSQSELLELSVSYIVLFIRLYISTAGLKSTQFTPDKLFFVITMASKVLAFRQFLVFVLIKTTREKILSTSALQCGRESNEVISLDTVGNLHSPDVFVILLTLPQIESTSIAVVAEHYGRSCGSKNWISLHSSSRLCNSASLIMLGKLRARLITS